VRSGSEFPVPWRPAAGRSWVRQPPGIGEVIDIPLARPRHAIDTDTETFLAVKRRIRAALRR